MAVAAIDAVACRVMLMAEGNRLRLGLVLIGGMGERCISKAAHSSADTTTTLR